MKNNPITIGFDDARFEFNSKNKKTQLIGVVCQGTRMTSVVKKEISIDGDDSTEALIELIKASEKHTQYVLTDAITFGGFNIYDMAEVYKTTEKPIIAISEHEVNLDSVKKALGKKFSKEEYQKKLQYLINAGDLFEAKVETAGGLSKIYYHCLGIEPKDVEELLKRICIDSKLPEPIRMAHIIGRSF